MLITASEVLLVVGKIIVSSLERLNVKEALLGLIGLFYLFDVDYQAKHGLGSTMLHYLVFGDNSDYSKFKNAND